MIKIDDIVFRASSIGQLMGAKGLGKTGEKLARYTYLQYKYGRTKDFTSKYTDKGTLVEPESIKILSQLDGIYYEKNEVRMHNDYFTGECDILVKDTKVIDIKNAWDLFTFDDHLAGHDTDNEYQVRVYMNLYNVPKAEVIYMLNDAPEEMILKEVEKESYKHKDRETPDYIVAQLLKNLIFSSRNVYDYYCNLFALGGDSLTDKIMNSFIEIPQQDRIKIYSFDYDDIILEKIKQRVIDARNYLKSTKNN